MPVDLPPAIPRPHVVVRTRAFGNVPITGPLVAVFINGVEWIVTSVGVKFRPDQLADINISFLGTFETVPLDP